MLLYRKDHNKFQVNFAAFHSTYQVETPLCSARDIRAWYSHRDTLDRDYKLHMVGHSVMTLLYTSSFCFR